MTHALPIEHRRDEHGGALTALMGLAAGAIGVWALDRIDWFMWDRETDETRAQTIAARPDGEPPAQVLSGKVERALGAELDEEAHWNAGQIVHYGIGVAPAVGFALLRDRIPLPVGLRGAAYGLGLFVLQDEIMNTATGLGGRPGDYPWTAHARGVVAHLVYGVVTDLALEAMERVAGGATEESGEPAFS